MKILVFRALQLGDLLCSVPTLRALRAAHPHARISLLGLPWAATFAGRYAHLLDSFIEFSGYPGLPERPVDVPGVPRLFRRLQREKFDLALQIHGDGSIVNGYMALIGAARVAGFGAAAPFGLCPSQFIPYPHRVPEIERPLMLLDHLGIQRQGTHLELPLSVRDDEELDRFPDARGLSQGRFVCIHPGARSPARRWPAERFAAVADALAARGLEIVVTGSLEERSLAWDVIRRMRHKARNLATSMSWTALARLVQRARLLVCNDTGVSHIAAAVRTPSVVVFTAADPQRWAPLDRLRHRSVFAPVPCRPCGYQHCPLGHVCAERVAPEDVLEEAAVLIA